MDTPSSAFLEAVEVAKRADFPSLPKYESSKAELYGLYKQATEGDCTRKRPSAFDIVGRFKVDAWLKQKVNRGICGPICVLSSMRFRRALVKVRRSNPISPSFQKSTHRSRLHWE